MELGNLDINDIGEFLFEKVIEGILITDENGTILLANSSLTKMFGYTNDELTGKKAEILIPEILHKGHLKERGEHTKRNLAIGLDLTARKKDGCVFPVEIGINRIKKNDTTFVFTTVTDISERVKISESLRKEKDKIELYMDISPYIFLVLDINNKVQLINKKGCEILSDKKDNIIGKAWIENFILLEDQEKVLKSYANIVTNLIHLDAYFECKIINEKGEQRIIGWTNEVLSDEKENVIGVLSVGNDITNQKNALDLIQKEKEKAKLYLDMSGVLFVALDREGNITMINKRGCEILGYECHISGGKCLLNGGINCHMEGKSWFENFIPEKDRNSSLKIFRKLIKGDIENEEYYKNKVICKNGPDKIISWHTNILKNSKGEITGTLSSGMDITKQHEAEKKLIKLNIELEKKVKERTQVLEESQQMYSMIARNFPNGEINVFDKDLNYVFVEGMELYKKGITGDMLIGTSFLKRIDSEIRDDLENKLMSVFKGKSTSFELETEGKIYMINAVGLHDLDKKINQILMVSQNITSLKKAENDIQQSLEKEKHLNELKSRFVSMASHEFRTPLTTAMNSISLLSRYIYTENSEEKQLKNINRVKTSIHHLTNILNDFLSIDKLEQGKVEVICSEFNFQEFTSEIIDEMEGLIKKGQKIKTDHKGKDVVYVDKQMLKNILNNLISNAIKYSPEHSTINIRTLVKNEKLMITVIDNGIGIPKKEQSHLFERFFRAKNAINIQGTGLGLNIIKNYLEMINGKIDFTSEVNKGSTFTVEIPICKELCETCS